MQTFIAHDIVIYPAHGVGTIIGIEPHRLTKTTEPVDLYVINFPRHKLTLRVPLTNADLRPISTKIDMGSALSELIRPRKKTGRLWSQRQKGYHSDLNSGDIGKITTLTRNLYATDLEQAQGKQSYSEREIYDEAFIRVAEELAAVAQIEVSTAEALIDQALTTKVLPPELKKL